MSLQLYDIRGQAQGWPITDRAWQYGDGVFRTLLIRRGEALDVPGQLAHFMDDAHRIGLERLPEPDQWLAATQRVAKGQIAARLRWILTAGDSAAGYARTSEPRAMLALTPLPEQYQPPQSVPVFLSRTRLSVGGAAAGAKTLNRLDQVMARQERDPHHWPEGLICDARGDLVSGIATNLFWTDAEGVLCTHPLQDTGVQGRTRARVLALAAQQGRAVAWRQLPPATVLEQASEIVLVNSLWTAVGVESVDGQAWTPRSTTLQSWLQTGLHSPWTTPPAPTRT